MGIWVDDMETDKINDPKFKIGGGESRWNGEKWERKTLLCKKSDKDLFFDDIAELSKRLGIRFNYQYDAAYFVYKIFVVMEKEIKIGDNSNVEETDTSFMNYFCLVDLDKLDFSRLIYLLYKGLHSVNQESLDEEFEKFFIEHKIFYDEVNRNHLKMYEFTRAGWKLNRAAEESKI